MKNKSQNLTYLFLTILFSVLFWVVQRPFSDGLINLFLQTDNSFISVINRSGLYIVGTLLLSSALAWKIKSKKEHSNVSSTVFLGLRIKRNLLFTISIILIVASLTHFTIFTATKIHSVNIISVKPYTKIPYSDIPNINIFASSNHYTRGQFVKRFYCELRVAFNIESDGEDTVSGVIPFGKIEEFGSVLKVNGVPYKVNYTNNCRDNFTPTDQRLLIENTFGVRFNL